MRNRIQALEIGLELVNDVAISIEITQISFVYRLPF